MLRCGVEGQPPLWELTARCALGAELAGDDGSVVRVHGVEFVEPRSGATGPDAPLLRSGDFCEDGSWHAPVRRISHEVRLGSRELATEWAAAIRDWAHPRPRKLHVVVNPFSGKGHGLGVWRDIVEPLLRLTPHTVVEHLTTGAGDASRYCQELELADDSGDSTVIAAVGGDGSMSEALNGLMARKDARRGRFTICFVPAGSSNAMAHMTGVGDALTSAWALAKCRKQPMDLFACHQGRWEDHTFTPLDNKGPMYGFLSVTGALVADIDIDSELCRCIGPSRFTAYALTKVFCCLPPCVPCAPTHTRLRYRYRLRWLAALSQRGQEISRAASSQPVPLRAPAHDPDGSPDWGEWRGDLQIFHVLNAPGISREARFSPSTRLDSGRMGLQWMDPTSRCGLIKQFDMMDKGEQLQTSGWRHEDVVAICVDDLEPTSKVVVDGESARPGASWQAEIMPRFVNVVVGSGTMSAFSENAAPQQMTTM